ncbi:glycosyl transferase [Actinomycetes bacterium]|nr:glycosyl transferase [Actinomycetes bacterium]
MLADAKEKEAHETAEISTIIVESKAILRCPEVRPASKVSVAFTAHSLNGGYLLTYMTTPDDQENSVSVILPVLNEEKYLAATLAAITGQDFKGDFEIILALGPSKDQTNAIAAQLAQQDSRIKLIQNPSGKTAAALNAAISAATHPIIVRVDGHALLPKDYIRIAVKTLLETGAVNVGGIMAAQGETLFEKSVALAMRSPVGVGGSRFHTGGEAGPTDTVYLGVFLKSAINAIGGFDPAFIRAQDWELNFRLRKNGGVVFFQPDLRVTYRPRSSVRALAKQYFEYGRWRREVMRTHPGTINLRYLAPPVTLAISTVGFFAGMLFSSIFLIAPIGYLVGVVVSGVIVGKSFATKLMLPIVLLTMHMSWGLGFLTSSKRGLRRG